MPANHCAAVADDGRDVGEGLDVVDQRRVAPQPAFGGIGGRGRGVPRLPSTDAISAVSSPHTNAPAPSRISTRKLKRVSADVVAQQAQPLRLPDGESSAASPPADIPRGSRCIPCCAPTAYAAIAMPSSTRCGSLSSTARSMNAPGIAFVGVADDVLRPRSPGLGHRAPLQAGRDSPRRRVRAGRSWMICSITSAGSSSVSACDQRVVAVRARCNPRSAPDRSRRSSPARSSSVP